MFKEVGDNDLKQVLKKHSLKLEIKRAGSAKNYHYIITLFKFFLGIFSSITGDNNVHKTHEIGRPLSLCMTKDVLHSHIFPGNLNFELNILQGYLKRILVSF